MITRSNYFNVLKLAFGKMSEHSDECVSYTGTRFANLFHLLDAKTRAGDLPIIDTEVSGLPILPDVVRIENDINRTSGKDLSIVREIKNQMINEMLVGKRMPTPQQLKDICEASYKNEIQDLKDKFGSNDFIVFSNALSVMFAENVHNDDDMNRKHYFWDYWPASVNQPFVTKLITDFSGSKISEYQSEYFNIVADKAQKFAGNGSTLYEFAREIDCFKHARTKEISRVIIRKLEMPGFLTSSEEVDVKLSNIEDPNYAWALHFDVKRLKSRGTIVTPAALLSPSSIKEDFFVNTTREETLEHQCSEFDRHVIMPPHTYRALEQLPEYKENIVIHIAPDDRTSLVENI